MSSDEPLEDDGNAQARLLELTASRTDLFAMPPADDSNTTSLVSDSRNPTSSPSRNPASMQSLSEAESEQEEELAGIVACLMDRIQQGHHPELEELVAAHPHLESQLRELWPAVLLADVAGHEAASSVRSIHSSSSRSSNSGRSGDSSTNLIDRMGDYELLEVIGQGGMGVVYRAHQVSLNRIVAIKMIQRNRLTSDLERQRFLAEAQATARLDHPGIVPVYDVGEIEGTPFFSMQLVTGCTLADRLAGGPLSQREAAAIIAPVARAIDYAHREGILHRDLKPSNILLDAEGRPLVSDFGLVKFLDAQNSLTSTGSILGTPSYMSPEQAAGRGASTGPAADVYSLGTVLYHCLTGRTPFIATSPIEMALKIIEHDPPLPRLLEPGIDRDMEMIVTRCLQKPPDLRYPTAAKLAEDLEAFLRDEPVSARGGTLIDVAARWFRETHHAPILENWGLLWIWHSIVLLVACLFTQALVWWNVDNRLWYAAMWTIGLGAWAAVFWAMRRQVGPVTFVERQIAHVWGASLIAIAMLWPLEWWLGLDPLSLSPLLGVVSGMVFLIKAGILTGTFYVQAACLFLTSVLMALVPSHAQLIFGVVAAGCFFVPGLKYYRQRRALEDALPKSASL